MNPNPAEMVVELPAVVPHHRVLRLEVKGRQAWRSGLVVEFTGLTCITGDMGTGKSTVFQYVLWAFGKDVSGVEAKLHGGSVELLVETKFGKRYRIRREAGSEPEALDEAGRRVESSIAPVTLRAPSAPLLARQPRSSIEESLFRIDYYSQSEIGELAKQPALQLELIDRMIDVEETRKFEADSRELWARISANVSAIRGLEDGVASLEDQAADAPQVLERLASLIDGEEPAISAAIDRRSTREAEKRALERIDEDLRFFDESLASLRAEISRRLSARIPAALSTGPHEMLLGQVAGVAHSMETILARTFRRGAAGCAAAEGRLQRLQKALAEGHAGEEDVYRSEMRRVKEHCTKTKERNDLQRRKAELDALLEETEAKKKLLRDALAVRKRLLAELSLLRDARNGAREAVCARLNEDLAPQVRIDLDQHGLRDAWEQRMKEFLGSKRGTVATSLAQLGPDELAGLVKARKAAELARLAKIKPELAEAAVDALRAHVLEIEMAEIPPKPSIVVLDGRTISPDQQSEGEKRMAVLSILCRESDRPLFLDQPEDHLGRRWEAIGLCPRLARVKAGRMIVVVTHSGNIAALAADSAVHMTKRDGFRTGSIDELAPLLEVALDGGREAFCARMRLYGHRKAAS